MKSSCQYCGIIAAAAFLISPNYAQGQLPLNGGQQLDNAINQTQTLDQIGQNISNRIQDSININPPSLNNSIRPQLDLNIANGTQNNVANRVDLQLGDLGTTLNQQLNLDQNGSFGLQLANGGIVVDSVAQGSIAQQLGLSQGDQILAINNSWVQTSGDISSQLGASLTENGYAWIYVNQNGQERWVQFDPANMNKPSIGVRIDDTEGQVKVLRVTPDSPAAQAGLKAGDIVMSVNGEQISTNQQLISTIQGSDSNSKLALTVNRNGQQMRIDTGVSVTTDASSPVTFERLNSEVTEIQKGISALVDEQVGQTDSRFDAIRSQVQTIQSNVGAMAEARQEQVGQLRMQTIDRIQQVRTSLNEMAQNQSAQVRERMTNLSSRLENLAGNLKTTSMENVDRTRSNTQSRLERLNQSLNQRVNSLRDRVQAIRQTDANGVVNQRLTATADNIDALRSSLSQVVNSTASENAEQLMQMKQRAIEIQQNLRSMQAQASAEANSNISAMVAEANAVRVETNAMLEAQFPSADDWTQSLTSDTNQSIETLTQQMSELQGTADENRSAFVERLSQEAASIRSSVSELRSMPAERIEMVRSKVATLSQNVNSMVENQSDQAASRIDAIQNTLANVQNNLAEVQRTRTEQVSGFAERQNEVMKKRLDFLRDRVDQFSGFGNDEAQARVKQISERVQRTSEAINQSSDRLDSQQLENLRSSVASWRDQLNQVYSESDDTVKEHFNSVREPLNHFEAQLQDQIDAQIRAGFQTEAGGSTSGNSPSE